VQVNRLNPYHRALSVSSPGVQGRKNNDPEAKSEDDEDAAMEEDV
jgi:hypothetical protein